MSDLTTLHVEVQLDVVAAVRPTLSKRICSFPLAGPSQHLQSEKEKNEKLGNLVFEVHSLIFLCEAMKEPEQYTKGDRMTNVLQIFQTNKPNLLLLHLHQTK